MLEPMKVFWTACLLVFTLSIASCGKNSYECIERNQKVVPNYPESGTHTEVDYVLLHDGHRINVNCCAADHRPDPMARCSLRVLGKYECTPGQENGKHYNYDLKCKDGEDYTYLYAIKKE